MKTNSAPCGLLLLHKETGVTSFEALGPVKRAIGSGKAGHTGTLDKFASGLLVILLGRSLKLAPWFSACDKEYEAVIRFGIETDTLDPEGTPVAEAPVPDRKKFEEILPQFTGEIMQSPPAYSAVHVSGKRAYELARSGKIPEMKKRPVTIHFIKLEKWSPPFASIRVSCSPGTYIRSLARDLAAASNSRAHLASLCRNKAGPFSLENAYRLRGQGNENRDDENGLLEAIQPVSPEIFEGIGLPSFYVEGEDEAKILHGKPLEFLEKRLPEAPALGLFSAGSRELAAVIEKKNGKWVYGHVFAVRRNTTIKLFKN